METRAEGEVHDSMTFGMYLREKRKAAGVTQRDLASYAGVDHTYISKLEHDASPPPSIRTCKRIAEMLYIPEEEIIIRAGKDDCVVLARKLHRALNNVIALFVGNKAYGEYSSLDYAFDALEEGAELLSMPLTVSISEAIDAKKKQAEVTTIVRG